MKRLCAILLVFVSLLSVTGCMENITGTYAEVTNVPRIPDTDEFLTPPEGSVVLGLADGCVPMKIGGYSWTKEADDGSKQTTHADQAVRPLPLERMESIVFQAVPIDGMVLSAEGFSAELGSRIELDWQISPDTFSAVCWPTDYETDVQPQLRVDCEADYFFAYVGSFIYELSAVWSDHGNGYSGEATYYIHITVDEIGVVPIEGA